MKSVYDPATGIFTGLRLSGNDVMVALNTPAGMAVIDGAYDPGRECVVDGSVVPYMPPSPPDTAANTWSWDGTLEKWVQVPTFITNQGAALAELDRMASQARSTTFTWSGHVFNADVPMVAMYSQDAANAIAASVGGSWSVDWVLANHSVVTLSAWDMLSVQAALVTKMSGISSVYVSQRAAILSATDNTSLGAINPPVFP